MRILFISRAYPPTVGGIENQNYDLSVWLGKIADVKTIANTRGRKFLPLFAPYALLRALFTLRSYDAVLLGDGNLAILAWFIKLFSKKPIICVIHGLDINWNSASLGVWYEKILIAIHKNLWVKIFLKKIDRFVAVGNETVRVAKEKGIAEEKVVFIPNGIDINKYQSDGTRKDLEKLLGENLEGKFTILTSGRLAKRKGAAWFVRNVMPKLPENVLYIVAGDGADKENITQAIVEKNLSARVKAIGYMGNSVRDMLFHTCDLFVQPNFKVPGDMEGFGISVIEAAFCGIPVLASNLEGLKDAIKDGEDGFLLESENADAWVKKINELLANETYRKEFGQKARQYVIDHYSWEIISKRYLEEISLAISKSK